LGNPLESKNKVIDGRSFAFCSQSGV